MSTNPELPAGGENLQFDRAEVGVTQDQAGIACSFCRQPIVDAYYQVNHRAACTTCLAKVRESFFGGSGLRRTIFAVLLGTLAALLGTGIYFGIEALTQRHFGLVAIVVGLLVGGAVRKGSAGRGGWFYQLMAILLTYASISGSYLLVTLHDYPEYRQAAAGQSMAISPGSGKPAAGGESTSSNNTVSNSTPSNNTVSNARPPSLLPLLMAALFAFIYLIGLSLAFPIMAGFDSPILLLITCIALYEAWKMNKRPALQITGPHGLEGSPAGMLPVLSTASLPPGTRP